MIDVHSATDVVSLLPPLAYDATTSGTGVAINGYTGTAKIILHCAAGTGNMTNTVKLQHSDTDVDGNYADISGKAFTQVTTTASLQAISLNVDTCKKYLRAVSTIAGTTPSFPMSVVAVVRKQAV
jgi:hypothetical protein